MIRVCFHTHKRNDLFTESCFKNERGDDETESVPQGNPKKSKPNPAASSTGALVRALALGAPETLRPGQFEARERESSRESETGSERGRERERERSREKARAREGERTRERGGREEARRTGKKSSNRVVDKITWTWLSIHN